MKHLYNFAVFLFGIALHVVALFNPKINLFVKGRKQTFPKLSASISSEDKTIWIHCASLGEFEQGRPIIEALRLEHPEHKIILSFFSPSGYEVRKGYKNADVVVYLPIDTVSRARKFIQITHPSLAIFVKYEFWPNMLSELRKNDIPTILIAGVFRKDQLFFKPYGGWMRSALSAFTHFFVQNELSKKLLQQLNFKNVTLSGDNRFDRVSAILDQDNHLDFLDNFVKGKCIMVAGSTWPKDEILLVNYINQHRDDHIGFIIAPHNINQKEIQKLKEAIHSKTALYSEGKPDPDTKVFIVDTVGILTKIYAYAHLAYVGGGFDKEGVHNVLEPAVFGIPLVIGPVFDKFEEAKDLVNLKGCLVANGEKELTIHFDRLFKDIDFRQNRGEINSNYIKEHVGATKIIMDHINDKL